MTFEQELSVIEQLFGVKIEIQAAPGSPVWYTFSGRQLTVECIEGIITQNSGVLEWQDPLSWHCNNNDNVAYLVVKLTDTDEDVVYDRLFAFDLTDNEFHIV